MDGIHKDDLDKAVEAIKQRHGGKNMIDEKYEVFVVSDEQTLKQFKCKKPILVIQKGNQLIKVASFNNQQSVNLFMRVINRTYAKVER